MLNNHTLALDAHTLKDLEVFDTDTGENSLFQFCDVTQTKGGAKALRQRMEKPWSNADHILATQASLIFILEHRKLFASLPSAYITNLVDEHYIHEILPTIVHENIFTFSLDVFMMWADHEKHRFSITRGVQVTCKFFQKLKRFVAQQELSSINGELALLINEMKTLLSRPKFSALPEKDLGRRTWKILRLDQLFRLHEKEAVTRLLHITYEIDALISMADTTKNNQFTMPTVENGPLYVHAEELVHPFVEKAIANPVHLDQTHRTLFLTGPNMAGKTTYLRAIATSLYFAHLGMGVPAKRFRFSPAEKLFATTSLSDDLRGGISYFRAEAYRVKAVAHAVANGERVIALMDEPFKGTNVKDALDASLAILQRFAEIKDCLFMVSSHLIELGEQLSQNQHVDCHFFEAQENEGRLRFDYLLHRGVSSQRLGMRVLREEGVFELLGID